jgi:RNA polymerase sigma-70 factor (ECF subfamily)
VAANTALDYFRRGASQRAAGRAPEAGGFSPEFVSSRGASTEPERKIFLEEIDRALKALSHLPNFERDYSIFWLYYRNGLTAKAISSLPDVKLTVKSVESILYRWTRYIRGAFLKDKKSS